MVKDHYQKLGFSEEEESQGSTTWRLDLDSYAPPSLEMTVVDPASGAEAGKIAAHA